MGRESEDKLTSSREMRCARSSRSSLSNARASSLIPWIATRMGSTTSGSARRLVLTPATSNLVSRGTRVLVSSKRIEVNLEKLVSREDLRSSLDSFLGEKPLTYPCNPLRPPCFPPIDRVNATAPPRTDIALSIPLGFPCSTFSDKNAQPSTKSASFGDNRGSSSLSKSVGIGEFE